MARNPRRGGSVNYTPKEKSEAWYAVQKFNEIKPQLTQFARSITGNSKVQVHPTDQGPYTRGNNIYLRPPLSMGRDFVHNRNVCGTRGFDGRQECLACRAREVINFYLFHEVAHIWLGTQEARNREDLDLVTEYVNEWHSVDACGHASIVVASASQETELMGVAACLNEYAPMILNAFEDSRVNEGMFQARPGLRAIFDINIERLMTEGTESLEGDRATWHDAPVDAQFVAGLYALASGYDISSWFHPVVVEALNDARIVDISSRAAYAKDVHETFGLVLGVFSVAQDLGFCTVPKCQAPPPPEHEDEPKPGQSEGESNSKADGQKSGDGGLANEKIDSGWTSGTAEGEGGGSTSTSSGGSDGFDTTTGEQGSDDVDGTGERPKAGSSGEGSSGSNEESSSDSNHSSGTGVEGDSPEAAAGDPTGSDDQGNEGAPDEAESAGGDGNGKEDARQSPGAEGHDPEGDREAMDEGESGVSSSTPPDGRSGQDSSEQSRGGSSGTGGGSSGQSDGVLQDGSVSSNDPDGGSKGDAGEIEEVSLDEGESGADEGLPLGQESPWDTPGLEDTGPTAVLGASVGPPTPLPEHGTPDDAARALASLLMHGMNNLDGMLDLMGGDQLVGLLSDVDENGVGFGRLGSLLAVALGQVGYFDEMSKNVAGIEIAKFPSSSLRWDSGADWKQFVPNELVVGQSVLHARRVFEENKRTKLQPNMKSGKVNSRKIWKAAVGDEKLFGKKLIPKKRSYFVVITGDCSASTWSYQRNSKIKRMMMAQGELLHRLGVPFVMYGHSASTSTIRDFRRNVESDYYVYMLPIKEEHEGWGDKTRERLAGMMPISENLDGHTLEFCRKQADKSNATDVIILYYTDGEMPAANGTEEREILQREVALCRKKGYHLLGVGINTTSPERYGMKTVRVDEDEDVKKVIAQLDEELTHL